jgi:hypothetical protein
MLNDLSSFNEILGKWEWKMEDLEGQSETHFLISFW